ncbi:zinc finger, RING/FYVE/PHD-type [Artemisia annua]|uniref:Zinc finger, RING/FYVE/PHD-type n=1 Tax=Artemisia annua TaxID=35608 RepID=A0A2U1NUB2_ARTAN|nr:zinc finger, RING/FYVE/PHD-type [Artemisia annua]
MDGRTQVYEEEEEIRVLESDEEVEVMRIEEEYEDDDDEDFKEVDELIPPKVTSWSGADGKIVHGIVVFDDDLFDPKISCQMDVCPICFHAWTCHGKHRICCLPCGHMYGLSCINKWLLQSSPCGKCPQCNTLCSHKDVILLHVSRLSAQNKASSARYFPFKKRGYREFKFYEQIRRRDARKLIPNITQRLLHVFQEMQVLEDQYTKSMTQWNNVKKQLEELEQRVEEFGKPVDKLGQADALKRQADALKRQADELEQHGDALEPRARALERRLDALHERVTQCEPRLKFFAQMYEEHQLKIKKKTELCTATPTCHEN